MEEQIGEGRKYSLRSLSLNLNTDMTNSYVDHSYDGSSVISGTSNRKSAFDLKKNLIKRALLLAIVSLLAIIVATAFSNQDASKKSISQLRTSPPTNKATAGTSSSLPQAPEQSATTKVSQSTASNSTTVDVNGHTVTVPANSDYNQTISSGNSTSSISVSNHSSSTGSGASNNSSTTVNISSQ